MKFVSFLTKKEREFFFPAKEILHHTNLQRLRWLAGTPRPVKTPLIAFPPPWSPAIWFFFLIPFLTEERRLWRCARRNRFLAPTLERATLELNQEWRGGTCTLKLVLSRSYYTHTHNHMVWGLSNVNTWFLSTFALLQF